MHQAITWVIVDPVLYHHMASPGHNELIYFFNNVFVAVIKILNNNKDVLAHCSLVMP